MTILIISVVSTGRMDQQASPSGFLAAFPCPAGRVKPADDAGQLQACLRAGMVTEGDLERTGVLTIAPLPGPRREAASAAVGSR